MERANVTKAETARLFVAMPVPAEVKERVQASQGHLRRLMRRSTVNWARPEQMHLTLRFFGSVSVDELEAINAALHDACAKARTVDLMATGLGVFPNKRRPHVIWTGIQELSGELELLHNEISRSTAMFGQAPENRSFSPHLTLGRIKELNAGDCRELRRFLDQYASAQFGEWNPCKVELIKSDLGKDGSKHTVVNTHILRSDRDLP